MYQISIVDLAPTPQGLRVAFAAGTDEHGRSVSVSFDPLGGREGPVEIRILPDIPQADGGPALPGWVTFVKTLTGDQDYLCEPPFPVEDLTGDAIYEGLSGWAKQHLL
ncbi:hypothetical protein [Deinococcus sp. NW-56]|uniref:hypothetical protein n=1 Tax=Deinococcus sp. NW-56 TaxID=2080419 RepID=UPI000CF45649|nr:hypothetical protein [Deinococcus sp. NW-56]